ncbi:uncharacterized protein [Periplaneta americana]|uniref:uncharacterized protein n=1 Tax=Periplaneta americana TaxID=6978 RepID=UPI0037E82364
MTQNRSKHVNKMKLPAVFLSVAFMATLLRTQVTSECITDNPCLYSKCPWIEKSECEGVYYPKVDRLRCCTRCVIYKDFNESCAPSTNFATYVECKQPFVCKNGTCVEDC